MRVDALFQYLDKDLAIFSCLLNVGVGLLVLVVEAGALIQRDQLLQESHELYLEAGLQVRVLEAVYEQLDRVLGHQGLL